MRTDPRYYVIHADMVPDTILAQMTKSGIGANFHPEIKHLIADSQVANIGTKRVSREWPFQSFIENVGYPICRLLRYTPRLKRDAVVG